MYSSLGRIDIVTDDAAILTDHRGPDEIAGEIEESVLFAMTRVLGARRWLTQEGRSHHAVVYASIGGDVPPPLREALGATGAVLECLPDRNRIKLAGGDASAIAERAFAGLARRVHARTGLSDSAATLRALEAETYADPPL